MRKRTEVLTKRAWAMLSFAIMPFTLLDPLRASAEESPFEPEIRFFEEADRVSPPAPGGILLYGSSSIRLWDLAASFPDIRLVNRGFGGSTISDCIRYAPRVVFPHNPRLIVFYAGDNDTAGGVSAASACQDFKTFAEVIHQELPDTRILFIAIKPSIARAKFREVQSEANRLIREFIATDSRLSYLDVFSPMLGPEGRPRGELFVADGLHLSRAGYQLWTDLLRPHLKQSIPKPTDLDGGNK
ncbi:MAG: hypothetical protein HUU16_02220 [Candidatus Omnitrophica bacterium]|nr:hypothetical protein [bacterium]NUN94966.1 hypothetical protein [Candidatus Omnitrophota bacterium]